MSAHRPCRCHDTPTGARWHAPPDPGALQVAAASRGTMASLTAGAARSAGVGLQGTPRRWWRSPVTLVRLNVREMAAVPPAHQTLTSPRPWPHPEAIR